MGVGSRNKVREEGQADEDMRTYWPEGGEDDSKRALTSLLSLEDEEPPTVTGTVGWPRVVLMTDTDNVA